MPDNTLSNKIDYSSISRGTNNFSFVDTLGSFINNNEFKYGFNEFKANKKNADSYIYEALSAIGDDFGTSLYGNVLNYIDNVSNVDTCKVRALMSMMYICDMNYDMLKNIDYYPIEMVRLIDILSINKKYLFANGFMQDGFKKYLVENGIISCVEGDDVNCKYNLQNFTDYTTDTLSSFIFDMLSLTIGKKNKSYAYSQISGNYGNLKFTYQNNDIEIAKKKYNIDPKFNPTNILDDIEVGDDSMDNYTGYELELLKIVKQDRDKALTYDPTSRYYYYKTQKVLEFARFVDNTYVTLSDLTNNDVYEYDKNFIEMHSNSKNRFVLDTDLIQQGYPEQVIDKQMVENVAITLTNMIDYICNIREKIKTQARKIFLKGTNNLLRITVNEFLIDYIRNMRSAVQNSDIDLSTKEAFYTIYGRLSSHSISDVFVQEYYDETEYMNLSTCTTYLARYGKTVNPRFFDEYFTYNSDTSSYYVRTPKNFSEGEIENFYLNTLQMKNILVNSIGQEKDMTRLHDTFYRFLEVVYDVGANTSYYDKDLSVFGSKMNTSEATSLKYKEILELEEISGYLEEKTAYCGNYKFDETMTLGEQYNDFYLVFYNYLSVEYLSAVSATYLSVQPVVDELSGKLKTLKQDLEDYLSSTYSYYFCKSDSPYCLDEKGRYNLDYFVGNSMYSPDEYYINRWEDAYNWIQENCHNWPILCAMSKLSVYYCDISAKLYNEVVNPLILSGYYDKQYEDLEKEMDDVKQYIEDKRQERTTFIVKSLDNIREQANNLKGTYDNLAINLDSILAALPDTSQGYYYYQTESYDGGTFTGSYYALSQPAVSKNGKGGYVVTEQDIFSGKFFRHVKENEKGGPFERSSSIPTLKTDSFESKCTSAIDIIETLSKAYYGDKPTPNTAASREPFDSILTEYNRLPDQLYSIIDQIITLFFSSDIGSADERRQELLSIKTEKTAVEDKIIKVIEFLGSKITEKDYDNDVYMTQYNQYLTAIEKIRIEYLPYKDTYTSIWTEFSTFLQDYTMKNQSTYSTFTLRNVLAIYDFTVEQDKKELKIINAWFDEQLNIYKSYVQEFQDLCDQKIELYDDRRRIYVYEYSADALEACLEELTQKLLVDVQIKTDIGNELIAHELDDEYNPRMVRITEIYCKYLRHTVGDYDENKTYEQIYDEFRPDFENLTGMTWFTAIQNILNVIDYRNDDVYKQSEKMFRTYSGVPDFAYDPYYNHKNLAHPSYQIHPFLWNFVECNNTYFNIDEMFKLLSRLDYEELEYPLIAQKIDTYIGKFGQVINKWQAEWEDYTGYTTTYETSDHVCKFTNISSQVVGYDGAFYPEVIQNIHKGTSSFYDLSSYYTHLRIEESLSAFLFSKWTFDKNLDLIRDITSPKSEENVFDIYRYGLDYNDNVYVLYKNYGKKNLTEQEKLNTKGELWIRTADSPLAFPFKDLLTNDSYEMIDNLDIYDFHIIPSEYKIILTYKWNGRNDDLQLDDIMESRVFFLDTKRIDNTGISKIYFSVRDPHNPSDMTNIFPSQSQKRQGNKFMSYVGTFDKSDTMSYVIYITHDISSDVDVGVSDQPTVTMYSVHSERTLVDGSVQYRLGQVNNLFLSTNPPFSYYNDMNLNSFVDFVFVQNIEPTENDKIAYKNRNINVLSNSQGYAYDDITHSEMNSHDNFNQNILIATVCVEGGGSVKYQKYNTNADMGYIPSYPGISADKILDINSEIKQNYQTVELMGRSKNIDGILSTVNENPDPHMTKDSIFEKGLFGRVYEEFDIDKDKTLELYENCAMFKGMPEIDGCRYNRALGLYQWDIDLHNYTDTELSNLRLLAYNTNTLGKNPYVIADMSWVLSNCMEKGVIRRFEVNYNDGKKYDTSEYSFRDQYYEYKILGINNGVNQTTSMFNNTIPNISKITYSLFVNMYERVLRFEFHIRDHFIASKIEEGTVKIALLNPRDFTIFEMYHMLDQNSLISTDMSGAYYIDPSGERRQLSDLQLSDYTDVNKICIMSSFNGLQFKYSEEDTFPLSSPNYYFPSINMKIPYTFGTYYDEMFISNYVVDDGEKYIELYKENEIYTIKLQDGSILSNLEFVDIDKSVDLLDDFRAFEDYNVPIKDWRGQERMPHEIYSPRDPRFYQYVKFYDQGDYISGDGIAVPDSVISNVYVDVDYSQDKFSQWLINRMIFAKCSENHKDSQYDYNTFSISQLSEHEQQKLKDCVKELLKIYVSYKKTGEGIVLQVNQQNYTNSPFIEYRDNKEYSIIKEGTYATIKSFEDAYINILIQLCQYEYGKLIGIRDIQIARYRIYNISDDKPKFIIRRVNELGYGELGEDTRFNQKIIAERKSVQISKGIDDDYFNYKVYVNSNIDIGPMISCSLIYDPRTMTYLSCYPLTCCTYKSEGWLDLTFSGVHKIDNLVFKTTTYGKKTRLGRPNAMVVVDEFDLKGLKLDTQNGHVTYRNGQTVTVEFIDTIGLSTIAISCVPFGDKVTAPPFPDHRSIGYVSAGWDPDESVYEYPDNDMNVYALYKLQQYFLKAVPNNETMGYVKLNPEGGTYEHGTKVNVEAVVKDPNKYEFIKWSGEYGTSPSLLITMSSNVSLTAEFQNKSITYYLSSVSDGYGTVQPQQGSISSKKGYGEITCKASPYTDMTFHYWEKVKGNCTIYNQFQSETIVRTYETVQGNAVIKAHFIEKPKEQFLLTVRATEGGYATGTAYYLKGTYATAVATAMYGYAFQRWEGDINPEQSENKTVIVEMNKNKTITAVFIPGIEIFLKRSGGKVTAYTEIEGCTITNEHDRGSGKGAVWTHSTRNGIETVTFKAEKEGYNTTTRTLRLKRSSTTTYEAKTTVQQGFDSYADAASFVPPGCYPKSSNKYGYPWYKITYIHDGVFITYPTWVLSMGKWIANENVKWTVV